MVVAALAIALRVALLRTVVHALLLWCVVILWWLRAIIALCRRRIGVLWLLMLMGLVRSSLPIMLIRRWRSRVVPARTAWIKICARWIAETTVDVVGGGSW